MPRMRRGGEGMDGWLRVADAIDRISRFFGLVAAAAVLAVTVIASLDAIVSYFIAPLDRFDQVLRDWGLGIGWALDWYRGHANSVNDLLLVLFAVMVMIGAPWTLKVNEHVRVDLLYTNVGERTRIWIDLLGGFVFLLPICVIMIWFTWPWFVDSWISGEMGNNAGGLPRWPSKLMLPVGFALVALQGVSEIIKCVAALRVGYVRPHAYVKPVQ